MRNDRRGVNIIMLMLKKVVNEDLYGWVRGSSYVVLEVHTYLNGYYY